MQVLTKYWFLEGFNLFQKLDRSTMMQLSEILEMENINKGSQIALKNRDKKCIVFLKTGTVKIVNAVNDVVKYVVKRGNIFGELALYDEGVATEELAYALEDCTVCYIEADRMEAMIKDHKSLKNEILKIYGLRIKKLERRLQDLLYKDSPKRIADFITDYLEEFAEKDDEGKLTAKNLLSHKDISNLTNTSRQTVSNTLSAMRKKGLIFYDSKIISMTANNYLNINNLDSQIPNNI